MPADLGNGVGIPVYGPNGRDGQCGLGFVPGVRRLRPAVLREFQWVCQLAHLRYCALLIPTLGPAPRLSEREVEVLGWVARGKSNSLIGDILGISAHTVDAHMRRICLKLGVSDRISAAVRGIGVGLIHAPARGDARTASRFRGARSLRLAAGAGDQSVAGFSSDAAGQSAVDADVLPGDVPAPSEARQATVAAISAAVP